MHASRVGELTSGQAFFAARTPGAAADTNTGEQAATQVNPLFQGTRSGGGGARTSASTSTAAAAAHDVAPDVASAVVAAARPNQGGTRCTYVNGEGRGCQNPCAPADHGPAGGAGGSGVSRGASAYCTHHTCHAVGCTTPKPSAAKFCASHAEHECVPN